jgi:general secretion pathway protein H
MMGLTIRPYLLQTQRGFTLIEILAVVIVIVVMVSVVSFVIPGNDSGERLYKQAEKFHTEISYIAEQSVLKGETQALFVARQEEENEDGVMETVWCYQWMRVRDRQWQALPELSAHNCFDFGTELDIVINGKKWTFNAKQEQQEPIIGFFPSGDATADVELLFVGSSSFTPNFSPNPMKDIEEEFWVNQLGEIHWLSEERRQGIETRIERQQGWFK